MAAGFLHQDVCHSTLANATAAKWSEQPAGATAGTTSYLINPEWSGTAWVLKKYTISSTGVITLNSTTNAPVLAFPPCDTFTNFQDGMALGWGVAAAMIAAYAIKFLADRRAAV